MIKYVILVAFATLSTCDVSSFYRPQARSYAPLNVNRAIKVVRASPPNANYGGGGGPDANARILKQDFDILPDGSYSYSYETDNGIAAQEQAKEQATGPEEGIKRAEGAFSWTSRDGQPVRITYVADENGYQPQGDIPQIPAAILRALEWNRNHPEEDDYEKGGRKPGGRF